MRTRPSSSGSTTAKSNGTYPHNNEEDEQLGRIHENPDHGHHNPRSPSLYEVIEFSSLDTKRPPAPLGAVPGRPRPRRRKGASSMNPSLSKKKKRSFWQRLWSKWFAAGGRRNRKDGESSSSTTFLFVAVPLWYGLGVLSIGTSKVLLSSYQIPPLLLTLQQLLLGTMFLRCWMQLQRDGQGGGGLILLSANPSIRSIFGYPLPLIWTGLCFALGFYTTNFSFHLSAASFVETVKAGEPMTSAALAVAWGVEQLSLPEVLSLASIVIGVLLSTLTGGHNKSASVGTSLVSSLKTSAVVMTANLCFSFRGLHQKLFRKTHEGKAMDDANLQFRMQQVGAAFFAGPALLHLPHLLWKLFTENDVIQSASLIRYIGLSLLNGFAFSSYNLASTYILTRISMVHHATLNCIRRVFAIVVTSLMFNVPITVGGAIGILISVAGFMSFTHYKRQKSLKGKPISSLLPMSEA